MSAWTPNIILNKHLGTNLPSWSALGNWPSVPVNSYRVLVTKSRAVLLIMSDIICSFCNLLRILLGLFWGASGVKACPDRTERPGSDRPPAAPPLPHPAPYQQIPVTTQSCMVCRFGPNWTFIARSRVLFPPPLNLHTWRREVTGAAVGMSSRKGPAHEKQPLSAPSDERVRVLFNVYFCCRCRKRLIYDRGPLGWAHFGSHTTYLILYIRQPYLTRVKAQASQLDRRANHSVPPVLTMRRQSPRTRIFFLYPNKTSDYIHSQNDSLIISPVMLF